MPPNPAPTVPRLHRLVALASVAYVASLAVWIDGGPGAWLLAIAAAVVGLVAMRRASGVARVVGWGLAIAVAALGAGGSRALDAWSAAGAAASAGGACVAVARIPWEGGVVKATPLSPRPPVAAIAIAWALAIAARVGAFPSGVLRKAPALAWLVDHASVASGFALAVSASALFATAEWTLRRRRLELGVVERAVAMRGLLWLSLVAAGLLVLLAPSSEADGASRLALALASTLVSAAALHRNAVSVARAARRTTVLAIVGGGVALLGASAAAGGYAGQAWAATLVVALVALAIGSAAGALEAPLRPARGAWLDAFARAADEAGRAEPDDALREALVALRAPAGLESPSPEVWTFAPTRVTTVDAAGYMQERAVELPEALVLVAAGEPEATLRAEVLDALEVRRPDLRPLGKWMIDRGAMLATVIACDGETEGVLVLPRGGRDAHRERVTLEEVRALKRVADRLAAACRARAAQSRMLARAHAATLRADAAEEQIERLRHERGLDAGRDALATTRLARPATVGVYSAASRMALEALERRTLVGAPIAVVAPSGVDPVPYLARAHLAGARRAGPMVLVDATSAREHDPERWIAPESSPLALAHRGMLLLLDGASLPAEVQQIVARALAEKRAPWERPDAIDVQLALTGVASPEDLVAAGRLDAALALRLGDARSAPVTLPRMADRPEDLRAIVTDRLAREGLRVRGQPVGIDHAAFARLVEYSFPGEDAELAAIVQRLVARCAGDVVRAADVDALELAGIEAARQKDPLSA
jgi:hypothetical protein